MTQLDISIIIGVVLGVSLFLFAIGFGRYYSKDKFKSED